MTHSPESTNVQSCHQERRPSNSDITMLDSRQRWAYEHGEHITDGSPCWCAPERITVADNRFGKCQNISDFIYQVVGAGTSPTNWMSERIVDPDDPLSYAEPLPATRDTLGRECIFQSEQAQKIGDEAMEQLEVLVKASLAKHLMKTLTRPTASTTITEMIDAITDGWKL